MRPTRRHLLSIAGAAALATPFLSRRALATGSGPIKLGVVTALSGAQEFIGNFVLTGAKIAVEQINADGGIDGRMLELVVRDDRNAPADAAAAARELVGMGANLQLGTISSSIALAMGPLMEQEGGVAIATGAGTEKLNHENYSPNMFRHGDGPYMRMRAEAHLMATEFPDVTSWTGIVPDHEYGRTTWAVFVDGLLQFYPELAGKEPEILDPIIVPYGVGDYRSFVTQLARSPAKGVFNSSYGGDAVTLFQQARPFNIFKDRVLMDSANEFIIGAALKDKTPGHWTGIHWYYEVNKGNPVSDRLYEDYVKLTGDKAPMGWVCEAHAAVLAYAAAIRKTGGSTETQDVIAALKGLEWETATGHRTIRAEDNQAIKDIELIRIEPDATAEAGYRVTDFRKVDGKAVIEPPTPGEPMKLRKPA